MNPILQQLENRYLKVYARHQAEEKEREAILLSDEYIKLSEQIRALKEKQDYMLEGLPNSKPELEELKEQIITNLQIEGLLEGHGQFKCITKQTNKVNTAKLLDVLGGDMDLFCQIANVTQKSIKEICKTQTFKPLKKELEECIEPTGQKITDIYIENETQKTDETLLADLPF